MIESKTHSQSLSCDLQNAHNRCPSPQYMHTVKKLNEEKIKTDFHCNAANLHLFCYEKQRQVFTHALMSLPISTQ